jgi:hypothetical protein
MIGSLIYQLHGCSIHRRLDNVDEVIVEREGFINCRVFLFDV